MAQQPVEDDWLPTAEAARRVSLSVEWFRLWLRDEDIEYVRRGRKLGVRWSDVEAAIERNRLTKVSDRVRRNNERDLRRGGVELLGQLRNRFDWSDADIAHALDVDPSAVCRWRLNGVPPRRMRSLRQLAKLSPPEVAEPRRFLDPTTQRELSRVWVLGRARSK